MLCRYKIVCTCLYYLGDVKQVMKDIHTIDETSCHISNGLSMAIIVTIIMTIIMINMYLIKKWLLTNYCIMDVLTLVQQ